MLLTWSMTARPKVVTSLRLCTSLISGAVATIPPASAAETNTIARNSRPLPMKTEENS